EGDGARFSVHGNIGGPRHFTFWREEPLREVLAGAGWEVDEVRRGDGLRGEVWLDVFARRR
ncbi:MAG: methyltransferase domain-containing protein, partial [Nocardioides sp.]